MDCSLVLVVLLASLVESGQGCKVANWRNMTMAERLYDSQIIVHGIDSNHVNRSTNETAGFEFATDSIFHVYCVMKSDGEEVSGTITIERVWPRTTCSGTEGQVHVGDELIVALKRTNTGNYEWDEVNVIQAAAFPSTPENVATVANICGAQNWTAPSGGVENKCRQVTATEPCIEFTSSQSGIQPVITMWVWIVLLHVLTYVYVKS